MQHFCDSPVLSAKSGGLVKVRLGTLLYEGLSGIRAPSTMFLIGVFLGEHRPKSPPHLLSFFSGQRALGENFTQLRPALAQLFFVGDGFSVIKRTGTTVRKTFVVPTGATHLYLGLRGRKSCNP